MMKRNKCGNCQEKVKGSYNFCPSCGMQLRDAGEKYGMLGKNDLLEAGMPKLFGGLGGGIMNKMLGSAVKMLEKEMAKELGNNKLPKTRVKLMLNGKEVLPEGMSKKRTPETKILPINFSDENLIKWKSLDKVEPLSNLKRVENKINYEIEVPEVKSIKDVSIVKLENSMEVRAVGEKVGYMKRIPINLPLRKYSLLNGVLTLEIDAE